MVAVWSDMLPKTHIMPKNLYESEKLLLALKMSYDKIHVCPKGCILFRKEHVDAKYCPKCKSSRYMEVDLGDGQKRQLKIPMRVLRHLLFLPRLQRLFMTEESVKQMTWHKNGKRYNPRKPILCPNRPRKFIISHMRVKPKVILRVGILCTGYRHTVKCLSQTMKVTT